MLDIISVISSCLWYIPQVFLTGLVHILLSKIFKSKIPCLFEIIWNTVYDFWNPEKVIPQDKSISLFTVKLKDWKSLLKGIETIHVASNNSCQDLISGGMTSPDFQGLRKINIFMTFQISHDLWSMNPVSSVHILTGFTSSTF